MDEKDDTQAEEGQKYRFLTVPPIGPAHYAKNFIRTAVCELRFPTIFEIEDPKPPASFWKTIRKDYPNHEIITTTNLSTVTQAVSHRFRSKENSWVISLKTSSISLETTRYDAYEGFEHKLRKIIEASERIIDCDFFTRVGLRYINILPCDLFEVDGWVNKELIGPLAQGVYGDVVEYTQQIRGLTACGGYSFQHSLGPDGYVLDFDFFSENIDVKDALTTARKLHDLEFSMFTWSLGDKARNFLESKWESR
jgi:uncharacterized protein (TIGR04255 family)